MGPVTISERFVAQCAPVISSNYDTCGTVTKATIAHLNSSQLTALFTSGGLFADLDAWFKHSIEMKACGVRRYALYDWIMANADRSLYKEAVTGVKGVKLPGLLQPFIFGRQETVINKDHWKISNGWTAGAGGTYPATHGTDAQPLSDTQLNLTDPSGGGQALRVIRVTSRYGIAMDPNWFRQRSTIHILTRRGNGASEHGQWKVLATASNAALTFCDVVIADMNSGSSEPFNATPISGVIIPGVNNVNDYEKWCQNSPTIDPRKRVPFWVQTFRDARCVDSEYCTVFAKLMETNPAFREFGDLPLAERNKQDELNQQKKFVNDFFYNKPISANQTTVLWESLEAINSTDGAVINVGVGGKLQARRANFVGVREQLRQCDRYFDLTNNPLNLEEFFQLNYDIKRARESQGRKVTDIDWWTDSLFRSRFQTAMMQYYKTMYLDTLRTTIQVNQLNEALGVVYDSYQVKRPGGVRINIMSDEYFDDFRDQFADQNIESRGTVLLCLDIGKPGAGSIYYAMIAANRKVFTSANIDQLAKLDSTYRCVMAVPEVEQTLKSETGTVVVECPLNSAWVEGINADQDPVQGPKSANPSYSNLYAWGLSAILGALAWGAQAVAGLLC
jgi:hypothetical protein